MKTLTFILLTVSFVTIASDSKDLVRYMNGSYKCIDVQEFIYNGPVKMVASVDGAITVTPLKDVLSITMQSKLCK